MSSKITAYIDCVSPYSYFGLLYLEKNREKLKLYGVEIEIIPVFLGGINVGTGNKPPWTLPAKAKYSPYDLARAKKYFGKPNIKTPSFFPILSLLPGRALNFIKARYPDLLAPVFLEIFSAMWENGKDVSKQDLLAEVLSKHFSEEQVREILENANSPLYKQKLNDNTQEAIARGAFGCPWFWVRNSKGVEEPFFGSDRFHYMWDFLDLPRRHLALGRAEKAKI
ncbi:thioredoxin-like protein [Delitschia confertaspora ATCC 74209]|uniref:Glutathione S-transferase kappa n=1 Tax=Delitschia confertaspora ATCC 74209 TaxID=1513339 RepID=A0A9P4JTD4_9PLEO|nr:thioredoxin-like protein [Delitschia confertaspora ATCC 74209]